MLVVFRRCTDQPCRCQPHWSRSRCPVIFLVHIDPRFGRLLRLFVVIIICYRLHPLSSLFLLLGPAMNTHCSRIFVIHRCHPCPFGSITRQLASLLTPRMAEHLLFLIVALVQFDRCTVSRSLTRSSVLGHHPPVSSNSLSAKLINAYCPK